MLVIYLGMKFYFRIKFFWAIFFFKRLAPHQHRAMAILVLVVQSDIIVASFSIDTLNVIYRSHTLILLVCLPQICVHSSSYTSLIKGNALKKIITTVIFSRNHQQRRPRLLPSFMLMRCRFVRRNFIGHHRWNGRESTNQPLSFYCHVHLCIMSCLSVLMLTWCAGKFEILTSDGRSTPATSCQHHTVSGLDAMSARISGHC